MAGSKCAYLEQQLSDHVLGRTVTFVASPTLWVAVSTSSFDPTITGSTLDEVTAASYGRVSIVNDGTIWGAASGSNPATKANLVDFLFGDPAESWGTAYSVYLIDASTGGNAYYGADLPTPALISIGTSFSIPTGDFAIEEF